jgi:hypothetical protein
VAALAGGLLLLPAAHEPASATSAPLNLKNVVDTTTPGSVELVRQGGGRGGGGGGGHGGGFSGGGGGGGKAIGGGGGRGSMARAGGGPRVGAGPRGGGRAYTGPRSSAARDFDRSGPRAGRDYRGDRGRYADHNRGDHRRYADRGRDHKNVQRHRVWRNGAWVWVYGPGYYAYDYAYGGDCYWLRQQAYATGSPYWWSRYNACIGYY